MCLGYICIFWTFLRPYVIILRGHSRRFAGLLRMRPLPPGLSLSEEASILSKQAKRQKRRTFRGNLSEDILKDQRTFVHSVTNEEAIADNNRGGNSFCQKFEPESILKFQFILFPT